MMWHIIMVNNKFLGYLTISTWLTRQKDVTQGSGFNVNYTAQVRLHQPDTSYYRHTIIMVIILLTHVATSSAEFTSSGLASLIGLSAVTQSYYILVAGL